MKYKIYNKNVYNINKNGYMVGIIRSLNIVFMKY